MIYGLGMLESGIMFDFGQLVMDAEFARMIKHVVNGIPVNDESLAVSVIGEVGASGDFLTHKHTLQGMRSQSHAKLIDRSMRESWERLGSRQIHDLATQKARDIIETHTPTPLPPEVLEKIRSIVKETEEKK